MALLLGPRWTGVTTKLVSRIERSGEGVWHRDGRSARSVWRRGTRTLRYHRGFQFGFSVARGDRALAAA
jgi:hypothetical protein